MPFWTNPPPSGDSLSPGEGAHVHDGGRTEVPVGIDHPVGHHEAALGVSVVDLHRLARVEGVDVVGARGALAHGVLGQAEESVEILGESLTDGGVETAEDAGGAAAVALHARHGGLAL